MLVESPARLPEALRKLSDPMAVTFDKPVVERTRLTRRNA